MFKKDSLCVECGSELISLTEPHLRLCDDCIEAWRRRRDRIEPDHCIHGYLRDDCEMCNTEWE